MRVVLQATAGPNAGLAVVFDRREAIVLGRADPRLPHPDPHLGRRHVLLEADPPACRVTDLGSRNGTWVNGSRVSHADLKDGDKLRVGRTTFRVSVGPAPALDDTLADVPSVPADTGSYRPPPDTGAPADPPTRASDRPAGVVPAEASSFPAVPGYRIVREIGRGGMGAVYEAVREADGQTVALKVIRPGVAPSVVAVGRFLRETAVLRQIDHPAIVRHLANGEAGGVIWLAMEYVPGTDTAKAVKADGPYAVPAAVRVAVRVLQALAHAHGRGFVHRDVKPSNVLVYRRGDGKTGVKLADFGLARVYQTSQLSGLTLAGEAGGTPAFMPPEQVTDFRNVGPPADVYGAAATLYYLLAGAFPFDLPPDTRAAFDVILGRDPVPLRDRRPEVPEVLAAMVHAGLAKDPAHRPPSAEAYADALRPFAT